MLMQSKIAAESFGSNVTLKEPSGNVLYTDDWQFRWDPSVKKSTLLIAHNPQFNYATEYKVSGKLFSRGAVEEEFLIDQIYFWKIINQASQETKPQAFTVVLTLPEKPNAAGVVFKDVLDSGGANSSPPVIIEKKNHTKNHLKAIGGMVGYVLFYTLVALR